MNGNNETENRQLFDAKRAKHVVGKLILIGLTYIDNKGHITKQKQIYGKIISIDKSKISIGLQGTHQGELFNLPPDIPTLKEAQLGDYHLRETGEIVTNPDLLVTYDINSSSE